MVANRVPNAFWTAVISTVLCVASFAPQVHAAQTAISVQFEAHNGNNINNVVTGTAGLVPLTNWNTVNVTTGNGSLSNLKDSSANVTAATVAWTSGNTWSDGGAGTGGNDSLFGGYLDDNQCTATVTSIPYVVYDVYIYTHGDAGNGNPQGPYWVDIPSAAHSFADASTNGTGIGQFQICQNDHTFTPGLSTGVGTRVPNAGSAGNTMLYPNLTVASFKITSDPNGRNGFRAPINGFQIVDRTTTITSITPAVGAIAGGTVVTFLGTNFATGATITFGGVAATAVTFVDAQHYQATAPAHAIGAVNVVYTNGPNVITLTNGFAYSNAAPPTVTSVTLNPSGTAVGPTGGGTNIIITGANFVAGDLVKLGGGPGGFTSTAATNVTIVNSTTITCTTPAAVPTFATGPCRISVVDPSNLNATGFLDSAFKYTSTAPTVTSISPTTGQYNVTTIVTITGTGFSPNFTTNTTTPGIITCGGQALTALTFVSTTQLTGTIQPMTVTMAGRKQDVVVTNPDGNTSVVNTGDVFTYILRDPENDTGLQPGMIYRYYNNTNINNNLTLNQFPLNFDAFNKMGITTNFTVNPNPFENAITDNFAVDYTGMLNVPTDGVWTFTSSSDDGSLLYIGTTLVVNNNGGHGQPGPTPTGSIGLKAGFHRFRVQYCEGGGGFGLQVSWAGPGVAQIDIPIGTADFTGAGSYCDATPTLASLNVVSGALAGGTTINTVNTGSNFSTPNPTATPLTYPGNNPIGASTLTAVSVQNIPLTLVASAPTAGQFAINANNTLTLSTPPGSFAGGAPILLTTLNGLTAVLQPGAGGFSYTSNGTNYRTPENPVNLASGVNVKFFRTSGASATIAGTGANLAPLGTYPYGSGVTALDGFNPIKGLSLRSTTFAQNLMTGPLANATTNGTLLGFAQDTTNFNMKVTGYIQISTPGLYTFTQSSDDESRLFFGSTEVITDIYPVGNAGFPVTSVSNSINLGTGLHKFTVLYGQNLNGYGFSLQYSGPDNNNTLGFVPDSVLFADSAPPGFATASPLTPATGSQYGNTTVTATSNGINLFVPGAKIFVNGVPAFGVTVATNGLSLTFRTPQSTNGQVANVVIVNPNGMADTVIAGFTYDSTGRPPTFASVGVSPCVPGAYFRYYSSGVNGVAPGGPLLPNFSAFTPSRVGVVPTAEYVPENTVTYPATQGDGFSFQYTGYILIPANGTYSFYTGSDDGSTMYLGGLQVVVGNNNSQGITTRTGPPIALLAGLHEYTVQFAEGNGGYGNYVGWGTADNVIAMDPGAVYSNGGTTAHGGAPTTRIPSTAYYYIPPTYQASGTSNWSNAASWENSTNVGLGSFGPVQNTNADDGAVDSIFRFNGDGVSPFTAVNDSINNTPLYLMEFNSNINGNVISGNTLKTLGAGRFVQYSTFTIPTLIQNGNGTLNISAPINNRDSLSLTGNGTGVLTLSGAQSNYAAGTDIKNIFKTGTCQVAINGNASVYIGDGTTNTNGYATVDGGVLGINSALGTAGAAAYNVRVGTLGTAGTLRGTGNISGKIVVGANGIVFPGNLTLPNTNTPADTTNTLTSGTLGNLTVGDADLSNAGTLQVRVNSPTPGTISSDKLTVLSGNISLNSATLAIHVQASGNNATPSDTLVVDLKQAGGALNAAPFTAVTVSSKTIGGQPGNIGTNLQVLYVNSATFTPGSNTGIVGTYTNGQANPILSGNFDRVYVRLTGNVTPVTVDSFTAQSAGAGVLLTWNCVSEFQNAGFNVYRRSVAQQSGWSKVNPALVAGRITSADQKSYNLYDWALPGSYDYKLESVSTHQVAEAYSVLAGPVVVDAIAAVTGGISLEGISAAESGVELARNTERTNALSALFANSTLNAKDEAKAQLNVSNGGVHAAGRSIGLVRAKDELLLKLATVKSIDLAAESNAPVQNSAATKSVPSPASDPFVAVRGFNGWASSTSASFTGTKVVYQQRGVLLIPSASLPVGLDSGHMSVSREGRSVPVLSQATGGVVVLAPGYEDDYTNHDALFLRSIAAPTVAGRMAHVNGLFANGGTANVNSPAQVTTAFHDVYYDYNSAFRPFTFPPWFSGKFLTADAVTGTTQSFTVTTPFATSSGATLTVNLFSLPSTDSATPAHALQVVVNGVAVGQAAWNDSNKLVQLTFQIPSGALVAGDNAIDLVTPTLAGVDSQTSFLHSLTCDYTRTLDGSQATSIFNKGMAGQLYEVSNLPTSNVWVVDARFPDRAALVPYESVDQGNGTFKLRFVGGSGGSGEFVVVPQGMENAPLSVTQRQVKPLKKTGTYLAVGPNQFRSSVQPLLIQRAKEGLRGQFVDQEQLFDYYNYGRYGPAGIQNAVRSVRPKYLLLVGRTTYDYKNYSGLNIDPLCPSFLVSTSFWAQTTSDSMFGDLGSGYPEVSVGRLPVNTVAESSETVKHILNYAGVADSGWRSQIVADAADPMVGDFAAEGDEIIAANPSITWDRNYFGVTHATVAETAEALRKAACGGADFIIYNGHGNAARLGKNSTIADVNTVQTWTGDVVLIAATCTFNWSAKLVQDYRSIPLQALSQPQGGIAASIGTTTYMNSAPEVEFVKQVLKQSQGSGTKARWGDVLLRSQQWAYNQGVNAGGWYRDLSRTECLLGDPAMPLHSKSAAPAPDRNNGAPTGTF